MDHEGPRFVFWVALAIAAALVVAAHGRVEAQTVRISALVADVQHRIGPEGASVKSRVGVQLPVGSRIRTGPRSKCQITFPNGSIIRMGERTDLVIQKATNVQLTTGQLYARIISGSAATVTGEQATAAVKGTTLQFEVADDGTTVLTVAEGEVSFFNDLGTVTVAAAQQSTARPGEAPTRPIVVDPSSLMAWEASLRTLMIELEHPPQVGTDPDQLDQELKRKQEDARQRPDDAAAHADLARVLLDLGRTDEAQAAAERAVELAPGDAAYQGLLGYALLQAGRLSEAGAQFSQATTAEPGNARWQLGVGLLALVEGETEQAMTNLQQAAQLAPDDPLPRAYLAAAHLRAGDLAEADAAGSEAVALQPDLAVANAYLAYVRLVQGNVDEAVRLATVAVTAVPRSALAHEALGTAHFFAGDLLHARDELDQTLALNPISASAHLTLAKLMAAEQDIEGALAEARLAVALNPRSAPARSTFGLLLLLNNDPGAAGEQFEQALAVDPDLAEARTGWGKALTKRGHFREALNQQKAAISLDTDSASAHNNLGGVYASLGQMGSAIERLERAIELAPGWGMPYANLALVYLEQNRYPEALEAGEQAVELGERSPFVHTVLARICMRQGRSDRALAELRQAITLDEDYPPARFQLAQLHVAQDRSRDAVREILGATTTDPSAMLETRLYARTESTLAAGSDERLHLDARHSDQAADGRLSYFVSGVVEDTDGFRAVNQDSDEAFVEVIAGHQSRPTQQLVLFGSWFDRTAGVPGPVTPASAGDADDREGLTGCDTVIALRQRLSADVTGTVKYSYRQSRMSFRNPDSLTAADTGPFRQLTGEQTQHSPEIRVDADINDDWTVRAGYSHIWEDSDLSGTAGTVDLGSGDVAFAPFAAAADSETATAWIEATTHCSDQLSVVAGGYWGKQTGSPSVALPKATVLYRPDEASWLSLTADPIFRADAAELSPVEALANPWGLDYLNFAEGGAGRSYELRYQRQTGRSATTTLSLTHQRVRGLLVDVEDPALTGLPTRVLMDRGKRWVASAAYEQWLTETLTGRCWVRWQSTYGDFPQPQIMGTDWPYAPDWQAGGRLDYIDENGWRIGLEGIWVDSRFHDPQNTQRVGSYAVANLRVQRQVNVHQTWFVDVLNLTGRNYQTFAGFPQAGATVYGGADYRY